MQFYVGIKFYKSLLASYDRATELDPSLHAHTTLASLELWLMPWVQALPETQQGCSHKPSLFCTSKIRKVYKNYLNTKYEHYSTLEGFVSLFLHQVPHNTVKPTSGKQESTYRVTKNGQDRAHIDCISLGFPCMCVTVLI